MRRGVGISSLERTSATTASYDSLSDSLSASNLANLQSQLAVFQSALKTFAQAHGSKIKSDPVFRGAFSTMCAELGVDPLSGGRRGLWDWLGLGDWTFALAVQVVDVCLSTRASTGGLHPLEDVLAAVRSLRAPEKRPPPTSTSAASGSKLSDHSLTELLNSSTTITEADILRALKALEPLGSGYTLITIGSKKFIRSVPAELDNDSLTIFNSLLSPPTSSQGFTTVEQLVQSPLGWSLDRVLDALNLALQRDSLLWLDRQPGSPDRYYAPALFDFDGHL